MREERRESESVACGHDDAARHVQEASLASGGAHVLPTAFAFRQASWRAGRTGGRNRRADSTSWRYQPGDGGGRGGDDYYSAATTRTRGSAGATFAAARSARDYLEGSTHDGEAGERRGRRRNK